MSLRPRGRHKPPGLTKGNDPVPSVSSAPFLGLSFDAIRTSLNDLKDSTDVFPPLKSALPLHQRLTIAPRQRVSTSDEHAEGLAWRAVCILDAIYNASGGGVGPVSAAVLDAIRTFVGLLREISAAMEEELKPGRLHLQKRESRLAQFVARLDVISEAFKVRLHRYHTSPYRVTAPVEEQPIPATPDQPRELQTIQTIRLDTEVRVLRTVVLFGLSPVSRGYPSGCAGAL
ncbi:hypothetical protein B0H13DRAFT_1851796 [Mycena leptocephala]|nr:hypothetical protein B0H13DRAFT_1851796 [Mycena leptocephala]